MPYIKALLTLVLGVVWLCSLVFAMPPFPYWELLVLAIALQIPWRGLFFVVLFAIGVHNKKLHPALEQAAKSWPALKFFLKAKRPQRQPANAKPINLMLFNLYALNSDVAEQLAFLSQQTADVIALCEVNNRLLQRLPELASQYPYQYSVPVYSSHLGYHTAVLSKVPFKHLKTDVGGRMVHYEIQHPNGAFHFAHVHPHAPFTPRRADLRNRTTALLRKIRSPLPVVIGGDFNNVPWHGVVRRVCRHQNLKLAGLPKPTFPAEQAFGNGNRIKLFPFAPFDFVLVPSTAKVYKAKTKRGPHSDHMALLVSFEF